MGRLVAFCSALLIFAMVAAGESAAAPKVLDLAAARARGMSEAPGIARAAGLDCTVTGARFVRENKRERTAYYEVSCQEGLGYILSKKTKVPAPSAISCLEADEPQASGEPSALRCTLEDNRDQRRGLLPFIAAAKGVCSPLRARGITHWNNFSYFEILCKGDASFVLITSTPPKVGAGASLKSCLAYPPSHPLACKLVGALPK